MYPALAVLQALTNAEAGRSETDGTDKKGKEKRELESVLWIGGAGGMESELVMRAGIPYGSIPAAGVHGVGLRALPGNLRQLLKGVFAARGELRRFRPDILFFTGGFVAVPLAIASWLPGSPARRARRLLYVPDIEPGLALKTLARFADHIALTVDESRQYFSAGLPMTVTGYPIREELKRWELEDARRALDLDPNLPTLLVFGGSKGARSINQALLAALPDLLEEIQVVHITGSLDWPEAKAVRSTLPARQFERYHPFPYLHEEMGAALRSADLVISRAGASSLGEYPAFGLPAILVPYPYAWRYQQVNAQYLTHRGAALVIEDAELNDRLLDTVLDLFHKPEKLQVMRETMRSLARPNAAGAIAGLLHSLATSSKRGEVRP